MTKRDRDFVDRARTIVYEMAKRKYLQNHPALCEMDISHNYSYVDMVDTYSRSVYIRTTFSNTDLYLVRYDGISNVYDIALFRMERITRRKVNGEK